jgi:hypothetical protein
VTDDSLQAWEAAVRKLAEDPAWAGKITVLPPGKRGPAERADEPVPFMPAEGMITRPHDAPWERLVRGQRVTITHGDWSSAEMRVTDVITHVNGDETYVLEDAAITDAEIEARRQADRARYSSETCPDGEPADAPAP